jgi:hypothetical protein
MDLVPALANVILRHRAFFSVENEGSLENQTKKHLGARFFYIDDILRASKDCFLLSNLPLRPE